MWRSTFNSAEKNKPGTKQREKSSADQRGQKARRQRVAVDEWMNYGNAEEQAALFHVAPTSS